MKSLIKQLPAKQSFQRDLKASTKIFSDFLLKYGINECGEFIESGEGDKDSVKSDFISEPY